MSLAQPLWFFLLLLIPLLWLFYRRKPIQRIAEVPALLLWQQVIPKSQVYGSKSIQPPPLEFYVWAAMILCLVGALAQPSISLPASPKFAFILQNSASMQTLDESDQSRFARSKQQMQQLLQKLPSDSEVLFLVFPSVGEKSMRGTPQQVQAFVEELQPAHVPCDFSLEIAQILPFVDAASYPQVFLFTDQNPGELPLHVRWIGVGAASNNVGLVSMANEWEGKGAAQKRIVHLVVKNFASSPQARRVELVVDNTAKQIQNLVLQGEQAQTLSLQVPTDQRAEIRLQPADEMSVDDVLYCLPAAKKFRVLMPANQFAQLRRVLQTMPNVEIVEWEQELPALDEFDCWVTQEDKPAEIPRIVFANSTKQIFQPVEIYSAVNSELEKLLYWEGVQIREAVALSDVQGEVFAHAHDANGQTWPLIVRQENDLIFAFALHNSNWSSFASFPVFWAAWLEKLGGLQFNRFEVQTSSDFIELAGVQLQPLQVGFHNIADIEYAANLLDPLQSNNHGQSNAISLDHWSPEAASQKTTKPLDTWLLVVALGLFCIALLARFVQTFLGTAKLHKFS